MARRGYPSDLSDAQWALIAPHLPGPSPRGRPRRTDLRSVVDAILDLMRTGGQWRLLPADFPPWGTVWVRAHRTLVRAARAAKGQNPERGVVIMDAQSVITTERGALAASTATRRSGVASARSWWTARGFLITCRVELAGMSDRRAARHLTGGLRPPWPRIRTVIADAGDVCGALARDLEEHNGWRLRIVMRPRPGFEIVGPNWIAERTPDRVRGRVFAWLGRRRRLSKDHEFRVQTSETFITIAACALMLKRLAPN